MYDCDDTTGSLFEHSPAHLVIISPPSSSGSVAQIYLAKYIISVSSARICYDHVQIYTPAFTRSYIQYIRRQLCALFLRLYSACKLVVYAPIVDEGWVLEYALANIVSFSVIRTSTLAPSSSTILRTSNHDISEALSSSNLTFAVDSKEVVGLCQRHRISYFRIGQKSDVASWLPPDP